MPLKYKYLTFDCYGTLIDWRTGIETQLRSALGDFKINGQETIVRICRSGKGAGVDLQEIQGRPAPDSKVSFGGTRHPGHRRSGGPVCCFGAPLACVPRQCRRFSGTWAPGGTRGTYSRTSTTTCWKRPSRGATWKSTGSSLRKRSGATSRIPVTGSGLAEVRREEGRHPACGAERVPRHRSHWRGGDRLGVGEQVQ